MGIVYVWMVVYTKFGDGTLCKSLTASNICDRNYNR